MCQKNKKTNKMIKVICNVLLGSGGYSVERGRPYILQIVQVELKQTKNEKRKSSHECCSRVAPTSKHFLKDYCDSCTKFLFILLIV